MIRTVNLESSKDMSLYDDILYKWNSITGYDIIKNKFQTQLYLQNTIHDTDFKKLWAKIQKLKSKEENLLTEM